MSYNGHLNERDQIGLLRINDPKYLQSLRFWQKRAESRKADEGESITIENGYLPFQEAVQLVKPYQPFSSINPEKPFARDIRIEIADMLGLATEAEMKRIKFFTAVGSPLDIYHGCDCFIEYWPLEKRFSVLVTFDLTLHDYERKIGSTYADVIVSRLPDEETDEYLKVIGSIGAEALEIIRKKMRKISDKSSIRTPIIKGKFKIYRK